GGDAKGQGVEATAVEVIQKLKGLRVAGLGQTYSIRLNQRALRLSGGGHAGVVWLVLGPRSDYGASYPSDAPLPPGVVLALIRDFQKRCGSRATSLVGSGPLRDLVIVPRRRPCV